MSISNFLDLRLIWFPVSLCFPVLDTLFSYDYVTSGLFAQFFIVAGNHCLLVESWYITTRSMKRSCNGKCSFLYFVFKFSQSISSCFLAAFEIGRSDLADQLATICTGDCKVFDSGILQYTNI